MTEERSSRAVWWIGGGLIALLLGLRFLPEVENPLEPEPKASFVALQADGEAVAADGEHRLDAGRSFRLFAVLEATDWRGRTVYFTEAPALRLGGETVPADLLRPWSGGRIARIRWFTIEGFAPYLEVATAADLDRFRLNENFHPEWGDGWSANGAIDPKLAFLEPGSALRPLPFGDQRFMVRVELFDDESALTPAARAASPGAEAHLAGALQATRAIAALPGRLATVSAAFGRTQIEATGPLATELQARISALEERELAFERTRLLAAHLAATGVAPAALAWTTVDLAASGRAWGAGEPGNVAEGDLVQAGARVALLFRDEGEVGRLDPADLAFDLWKGLRIRRLDQIFAGDDGVEVELAALGSVASTP